jgi:4'-phosphopantetheinyl transferase
LWRLLSHGERARAGRFVLSSDRHRFVLAHAALRVILSRYIGNDPTLLAFDKNAYGRPELSIPTGEPPIRFNLSHTHGLVAVGVCRGYDIGIDVESSAGKSLVGLLELASQLLSPSEIASLHDLSDEQRGRRVLQVWTLKEAYIKARGLGLSIPLKAFSFDVSNPSTPGIRLDPPLPDDADAWRFVTMQPTPCHWFAAAVRAGHNDMRFDVKWTTLRDLE